MVRNQDTEEQEWICEAREIQSIGMAGGLCGLGSALGYPPPSTISHLFTINVVFLVQGYSPIVEEGSEALTTKISLSLSLLVCLVVIDIAKYLNRSLVTHLRGTE